MVPRETGCYVISNESGAVRAEGDLKWSYWLTAEKFTRLPIKYLGASDGKSNNGGWHPAIWLSVGVCGRRSVPVKQFVAVRLANMLNMITFVTCESGCGAEETAPKLLLPRASAAIDTLRRAGFSLPASLGFSADLNTPQWSSRCGLADHRLSNSAAVSSRLNMFFKLIQMYYFSSFHRFCCSSFAPLMLTCAGQRTPPALPADEPLKRGLSSAAPAWM